METSSGPSNAGIPLMEGLPSSRPAGFRGCSQVPEKPHFSQGQLKGPPSAPGENQWRFQLFNQRQSPESIRALADRLLPGSRSEPLAFEGGGCAQNLRNVPVVPRDQAQVRRCCTWAKRSSQVYVSSVPAVTPF